MVRTSCMPFSLAIIACLGSGAARAEDSAPLAAEAPPIEAASPMEPGWLPTLGAVAPGVLVHGLGHVLGGDPDTGYKLLAIEGGGLVGMAAGLLPIGFMGASPKIIGPAYASTLLGFGLFSVSWLADIYGSAACAPKGHPQRVQPHLETALGLAYVYDPQFDYSAFSRLEVTGWLHGLALSGQAWIALDDDVQFVRGRAAWRFFGPRGPWAGPAGDGSYVDALSALGWRRFGDDGFDVLTFELELAGRLDMGRLGDSLRGSFAELSLGWGLQSFDYHGLPDSGEGFDLLLMRVGYGLYLGDPEGLWGELMLYYDHRHDDFVAGSSLGFAGDGVPGHVGLAGRIWFGGDWGVHLDVQGGAAWLFGASLCYRYGGGR